MSVADVCAENKNWDHRKQFPKDVGRWWNLKPGKNINQVMEKVGSR